MSHDHDSFFDSIESEMLMGFFIVSYIGLRLLQGGVYFGGDRDEYDSGDGGDDRRGGNPIVIIALILTIAGAVTWFFGSILQAMVSRQREYLADASSVQYTRNPEGLANALRKIADSDVSDMPRSGKAFSHLYFNEPSSFWSRLFATHPPVEARIEAIEGGAYKNARAFSEKSEDSPPPPPPYLAFYILFELAIFDLRFKKKIDNFRFTLFRLEKPAC